MSEDDRLLRRLERLIDETDFAWSFCLVGEDQSRKLAEMNDDLKRPYSESGTGKRILSGYSYWGIEPTIAWQRACNDPYYPVMKDGIESFEARWARVAPTLPDGRFHYFSLDPGTGEKDRVVVGQLHPSHQEMLYVPVDLSAQMLRICVQPMRVLPFVRSLRKRILPVQLDFSVEENVRELDGLRSRLVGDEPVLFSLLGNTMANFDDDLQLVAALSKALMRPDDKLLLEVATASRLSAESATVAASEYHRSKAFQEFVVSALHQHTDLPIAMEDVAFEGHVDSDRSIAIRVLYRNRSGGDLKMMLPDRTEIPFPAGDTIRLYVTRKYERGALDTALDSIGLSVEAAGHSPMSSRGRGFGLDLLLLSRRDAPPVDARRASREVFRSPRS